MRGGYQTKKVINLSKRALFWSERRKKEIAIFPPRIVSIALKSIGRDEVGPFLEGTEVCNVLSTTFWRCCSERAYVHARVGVRKSKGTRMMKQRKFHRRNTVLHEQVQIKVCSLSALNEEGNWTVVYKRYMHHFPKTSTLWGLAELLFEVGKEIFISLYTQTS